MASTSSPSSSASSHLHSHSAMPPSETLTPGPSGPSLPMLQCPRLSFYEDIEGSIAHKVQLAHWRDEEAMYRDIVDSQEEIFRIRQNELYQLLGMFAVFQGVIFSGVAQSSTLTCADAHIPISLSLTTAIVTFMAVLHKLSNIGDMEHDLSQNKKRADTVYGMIEHLKLRGSNFNLDEEPGCLLPRHRGRILSKYRRILSCYGMTLLAFLLFLSTGIVVSCAKILCQECKCHVQT